MKRASKTATHGAVLRLNPRHDIAKFPYPIGIANISVVALDSATADWAI
jgi:hypothetical protein